MGRWKARKLEIAFAISLLINLLFRFFLPGGSLQEFTTFLAVVLGAWLLIRFLRQGLRAALWRLRNRLMITYVFIGVVPVLLIVALVGLSAYLLASQLAVFLVVSELDRKVDALQSATEIVARTEPQLRKEVMRRVTELYQDRYPGMIMWLREGETVESLPREPLIEPPDLLWKDTRGIAMRRGRYLAWSHRVLHDIHHETRITAALPLTRKYLSGMIPGLGEVYFLQVNPPGPAPAGASKKLEIQVKGNVQQKATFDLKAAREDKSASLMPPSVSRFDVPLSWFSGVHASRWAESGKDSYAVLTVQTRISALSNILFAQKADELEGVAMIALLVIAGAFVVVELVALFIGASLTRTVTGTVHSLYQGTQRVMHGDFSHRIPIQGNDQLADMGKSFNSMTANLERLVVVAKEKERLQAEIEIAREVQNQLYPKTAPVARTLRVTGLCQPARMVSGDYYDFQRFEQNLLAIAVGDVAGKGISAALLMASIQSAMRMELRSSAMLPLNGTRLSTARMVSELNQQLYATTAPEKYATFFFSLYDEVSGKLTYTNAGHLPPILFRKERTQMLEVTGTVMGAFPMSRYEESALQMEPGDLLVCYTDGITEPENAYGEMFGEERLMEVVSKNLDRDEDRIMELIMDAVLQWTGSGELQDDMTVLLARKQ
ncbi:MAG TPA: SpoIIE family protein phosphatase [Bryobacteraceae bacterium]|nr:SpoIIE family protein phosphatase [Bryobacteraceae bacterium]